MLRADYIFSYWIFAWFLLYYFKIIKNYNPFFAIILGLIFNTLQLLGYLYYKNYKKSLLFIIANIFLKIIPFYLIKNKTINQKDISFTIFLFILFIIYSRYNNKNQIKSFLKSLKSKKIDSPFSYLLNKLFNNL